MLESVEQVGFSITGEFITQQARDFWTEHSYTRALSLLECLIGSTFEQREAIIFGQGKLVGVNNVEFQPDNWTPPEGYCPSIKEAMRRGENYVELLRRREDEAWQYARDNWHDTRGKKAAGYYARIVKLVGEPRAKQIHDAVMGEMSERSQEFADSLHAKEKSKRAGNAVIDAATMARHAMAQRLEMAGFDPTALATPEAMINRGYDKTPELDERMESVNGWLQPNGNYYACGAMEHVGCAASLLPEGTADPEREAERLGWIKLVKSMTGFHCMGQKKPTKKQLNKLFDYATQHQRDYEEMIQYLPK